jgi:general secretion pathway protein C
MNRYFAVINLFLLTVTIFFGVKIFYKISTAQLEKGTYTKENTKVTTTYEQETRRPFANYKPIIDRNLFKTKKEALEKVAKVDVDALKPTDLRLKLLGTVSGDQSKAYAVIEDEKERQQNLYRKGDSIQDATLKMILREKVVLSVNDRDEVLEIEKIDNTSSAGRSGAARRIQPLRTTRAPRTQNISLNRSLIEEATQDIGKLMTDASIQPYFENGNPEGLRLSRIKMNSIFRKMGLRRGDIITGIDGQDIRSVDDALRLYDRLKSANNVKVEIKRRGQSRILDYNIK